MPSETGSIPMCMGPPATRFSMLRPCRVYPHVYGATQSTSHLNAFVGGLSPCVWGHLRSGDFADRLRGSIPMCMGPPAYLCLHIERNWVYPHVYGATFVWEGAPDGFEGLSPCVWCHRLRPGKVANSGGSSPMCMGPPSFGEELQKDLRVYPHVYGATLCGQENSVTLAGLSPCVWGHL